MFTMRNYVQPTTIEEAYKILMEKKRNTILGGTAFLKMGSKKIDTAVDLDKLGLNYIEEKKGFIEIGACTSLRELEINPLLTEHFHGVISSSVKNIIGVQFRNIATIGASVFSRYGFSDILTALLSLDTEVELYKAGRMTLEDFLDRPFEKDILTKIFIENNGRKGIYKDLRNSISDYPILNVCVSRLEDDWKVVVGARPGRATLAKKASKELSSTKRIDDLGYYANIVSNEVSFGTNERGSAEYRKAISKVLVKRSIQEVLKCK